MRINLSLQWQTKNEQEVIYISSCLFFLKNYLHNLTLVQKFVKIKKYAINNIITCKGGIAMHENRSCKIPTRSEFSDTVIKLTDHELRWLIPTTSKLKKIGKKLPVDHFTIRDLDREWETLIFIQEEEPGKYQVYAYAPFDCHNKKSLATMKGNEEPFFSLTCRFVLGTAKCEKFTSKKAVEEKIWKDFQIRIIPVILYMQHYSEKAEVSERQIKSKKPGSNKTKKFMQRIYTLKRVNNEIPENYFFAGKEVKIQKPIFNQNLNDELGVSLIIPTTEVAQWVQIWANNIRDEIKLATTMNQKKKIEKYPFYNSGKDKAIARHISCVRVVADDKTFMQLQINAIGNDIYQISYFDESDANCLMIVLVNLATEPSQYDIVYTERGDGSIIYDDDLYARRIATLYMDLLMYLRTFEFGNNKIIEVCEFPKLPEEFSRTA